MKQILVLVVFVLIGGGLYANEGRVLSQKEGKQVVADTLKKGNVDLGKLIQAVVASGQKPIFRLTQVITPVNISSTNKQVKVVSYTFNDTMCVVQLDVTGCKGKLIGIDTTAYLQTGTADRVYVYKIKSVAEAELPENSKVAMKWDAKKNVINLVFPGVKLLSNDWDWDLVLSTAKNGIHVKTRFGRR